MYTSTLDTLTQLYWRCLSIHFVVYRLLGLHSLSLNSPDFYMVPPLGPRLEASVYGTLLTLSSMAPSSLMSPFLSNPPFM